MIRKLLRFVERALTTEISVPEIRAKASHKMPLQYQKIYTIPNQKLVIAVTAAIIFFFGFLVLEIAHLAILGTWNQELFSAMTFIAGLVVGSFFKK